jgi:hypothetical protein
MQRPHHAHIVCSCPHHCFVFVLVHLFLHRPCLLWAAWSTVALAQQMMTVAGLMTQIPWKLLQKETPEISEANTG